MKLDQAEAAKMLAAIYLSGWGRHAGSSTAQEGRQARTRGFSTLVCDGQGLPRPGKPPRIVEAYNEALRRSPPAVEARESRIGRVRALLDNKQAEQASEDLDTLAKEAPEDSQVLALAAKQALALARANEAKNWPTVHLRVIPRNSKPCWFGHGFISCPTNQACDH